MEMFFGCKGGSFGYPFSFVIKKSFIYLPYKTIREIAKVSEMA